MNYKLYQGDCLEVMPKLEGGGIDMVLTDPPYGTTACKWDTIIPFDEMWNCINTLSHENTATVLFGSEPFSSALRMSNIENFRYDWVWLKSNGGGFFNVKKAPLKRHELISIFYNKLCTYNPQFSKGKPYKAKRGYIGAALNGSGTKSYDRHETTNPSGKRYPISHFYYVNDTGLHPTQKPVKLLEYLIKTYTNENDTVLDFTMGSGSTGVACANTGRKFIGIELDKEYFEIAEKRIKDAYSQTKLI